MSLQIAAGNFVRSDITDKLVLPTPSIVAPGSQASYGTNFPQLTIPSWPAPVWPISFWCWTYQTSDTTFTPMYLSDSAQHGFETFWDGGTWNFFAKCCEDWYDPGVAARVNPITNSWISWGSIFYARSSITMISPVGANYGTPYTDRDPTGPFIRFMFAMRGPSSNLVAEIAAWSGALSNTDISNLQAGRNPTTIMPANLLLYLPLKTDVKDYGPSKFPVVGVGSWTQGGAVISASHPAVDAFVPPSSGVKPRPRITMVA